MLLFRNQVQTHEPGKLLEHNMMPLFVMMDNRQIFLFYYVIILNITMATAPVHTASFSLSARRLHVLNIQSVTEMKQPD